VTVLGFFFVREGEMLGLAINQAGNWLHLAIAAAALTIGFSRAPAFTASTSRSG